MLKEAIDRIIALGETNVLDIDGRHYTDRDIRKVFDPEPTAVPIHTLTGIKDLMEFDGLADVAVHVADGATVNLVSKLAGVYRQRPTFAVARASANQFPFDRWMGHEEFVIALQTRFVDDDTRKKVLAFVGSIASGKSIRTTDDGVTQVVALNAGVTMKAEGAVPNPVKLAPFRTFTEIEQPASLFVLRVKSGKGEEPATCGLFGADADSWQKDAIEKIAEWFKVNVPGVPVIR